ncbi:MauE/DoxX family redox-associated membrane protein [Virgibacillus doumboii]|uniref:MauE/DoxX family redox-associated membrane protein n=1 Tax=Virgibacillus doumboii TaxID=2697503 RepID=UPI0013DF4755|nr:MauE/DoxX family redox-associated membrane protein [Virgibacillus doumboii]
MGIFSITIALFFAYVFMFSAVTKIKGLSDHVKIFTSYEILPHQFSIPFSLGFIAIEVISSLLIIFRFHAVIGIIMLGILTFIYTLAILINLLRGRKDLSCGCGGVLGDHNISYKLISRNILIISGLFLVYLLPSGEILLVPYVLLNILVISGFCLYLIVIEMQTIKRLRKELLA